MLVSDDACDDSAEDSDDVGDSDFFGRYLSTSNWPREVDNRFGKVSGVFSELLLIERFVRRYVLGGRVGGGAFASSRVPFWRRGGRDGGCAK